MTLRPRRTDEGLTLVEVTVTMALLLLVMGLFLTAVTTMFKTVDTADRRSRSNDQARLAVEELDRQVRSGNVLYDPDAGGMSLRVYTQTNADTSTPGNRCVQWRLDGNQLESRWWAPTWTAGNPTPAWRTVADHVVNSASEPIFNLNSQASFGRRIVDIVLVVNQDPRAGSSARVTASVTGRNTEFGYPFTACNVVPPA